MSILGKVRIGHKAPDFHCEAVIQGTVKEVSLSTYIHPAIKPGTENPNAPWLIILFIPAAFSFICPTEVLAFQNCLDEFKDRNCNIIFISVDTKHSLWHWQNVPRQYGGLGMIDIPLLSDATHRLARDYGVLIEDEGVALRGMFILDGEGIVQQITLNNVTVGRSVLEALRLLEAFQAVARHGVLCPVDWKAGNNASDTLSTISNTLTESYDERLANLQKEFGSFPVTDLDSKHSNHEDHVTNGSTNGDANTQPDRSRACSRPTGSRSSGHPPTIQEVSCERPRQDSPSPTHLRNSFTRQSTSSPSVTVSHSDSFQSGRSSSIPENEKGSPASSRDNSSTDPKPASTARHSRGHHSIPHPPSPMLNSKSPQSMSPSLSLGNTYKTSNGSEIVLEFADPVNTPLRTTPLTTPTTTFPTVPRRRRSHNATHKRPAAVERAASWTASSAVSNGWSLVAASQRSPVASPVSHTQTLAPTQTRLQATFDALKKMGAGLASPRLDRTPNDVRRRSNESGGERKPPGYFDVAVESDS